jgi:hypothetical protein
MFYFCSTMYSTTLARFTLKPNGGIMQPCPAPEASIRRCPDATDVHYAKELHKAEQAHARLITEAATSRRQRSARARCGASVSQSTP